MSNFLSNTLSNTTLNRSSRVNGTTASASEQAVTGLIYVAVVYFALMILEMIYRYMNRMSMNRTELLPYTYSMDDRSVTVVQNPNQPQAKSTYFSDNERSGVEFSYSFYLNVHPSTFRTEYGLLHIFHKGYSRPFPLMCPGVFMRSDTNTLRVYVNTFKTWNHYVEVENIPVGKWVHIVISCEGGSVCVYVNGNIARKMSLEGYAPYQNYQDVVCFSQSRLKLQKSTVPSVDDNGLDIFGAAKGMLSRLTYFSYALSYSEIQTLMNEGPSSKMDEDLMRDKPPYLSDTWWSQSY